MKKIFGLVLVSFFIFILISCSEGQAAKEQIQKEKNAFVNPLYKTAHKLYYEKKYQKGYSLLEDYVFNKSGDSLIIHSLLVRYAKKMNRADDLLKNYLGLKQQKFYIFANGVRLILEEKQIERNTGTFKKLVRKYFPGNPVVLMYLGYLYILKNRPHLAVATLQKSIDALPEFPYNHYYLALAHYHTKNISGSVESMEKAISFFPSYMSVEINAALKLKRQISR